MSKMMSKEEFEKNIKVMDLAAQQKGESQNGYFKRLKEAGLTNRSRTTLQTIVYAMEEATNIDEAYEIYCIKSRERTRTKNKKKPIQISVQELCPLESDPVQIWADCSERDMAKYEEPQHDLAAAYRFLRDQCIDVEINDMKHLIITVEVSKWESLF